jgi:DNA-binding protein YbaB
MIGGNLDDAEQWVASWSAGVSDRAARAQRMAAAVAALRAIGSAADGLIEVRVDGSGAVVGIRLDDQLAGRPMREIERGLLAAMRSAQATLTTKVAQVVAQTVGADTDTGRAVVDSFERRFPASGPEDADSDG